MSLTASPPLLPQEDARAVAEDIEKLVEVAVGDDEAGRGGVVGNEGRIISPLDDDSRIEHDQSPTGCRARGRITVHLGHR